MSQWVKPQCVPCLACGPPNLARPWNLFHGVCEWPHVSSTAVLLWTPTELFLPIRLSTNCRPENSEDQQFECATDVTVTLNPSARQKSSKHGRNSRSNKNHERTNNVNGNVKSSQPCTKLVLVHFENMGNSFGEATTECGKSAMHGKANSSYAWVHFRWNAHGHKNWAHGHTAEPGRDHRVHANSLPVDLRMIVSKYRMHCPLFFDVGYVLWLVRVARGMMETMLAITQAIHSIDPKKRNIENVMNVQFLRQNV